MLETKANRTPQECTDQGVKENVLSGENRVTEGLHLCYEGGQSGPSSLRGWITDAHKSQQERLKARDRVGHPDTEEDIINCGIN